MASILIGGKTKNGRELPQSELVSPAGLQEFIHALASDEWDEAPAHVEIAVYTDDGYLVDIGISYDGSGSAQATVKSYEMPAEVTQTYAPETFGKGPRRVNSAHHPTKHNDT
jgi:hypothetical protein